jgi:predicted transcriptional regulator
MTDKATTVRLDHRTLKRLDGIARAMSRSRSSVINEAVERYLEYEDWFVGAVKQGLKQVENGSRGTRNRDADLGKEAWS